MFNSIVSNHIKVVDVVVVVIVNIVVVALFIVTGHIMFSCDQ